MSKRFVTGERVIFAEADEAEEDQGEIGIGVGLKRCKRKVIW